MDQVDLEAHILATTDVARRMQGEAGHLLWIFVWDAQCGCAWFSYCRKYTVSQDGCHQWAYTPDDVSCFGSMSGMEYCELHYQAKRLNKCWDEDSWVRYLAWKEAHKADLVEEGTVEPGADPMLEWLEAQPVKA